MNKFIAKKSHKGFTIIQLVIGMLIFAILTGIAFYGVSVYTKQANQSRVASDLGTFEVAIKDYMLQNSVACSDGTLNLADLNSFLTDENKVMVQGGSAAAPAPTKPADKVVEYGRSVLKDPWGHEYYLVIDNNEDLADTTTSIKSTDNAYIYVYSAGKDGRASNDDDQLSEKSTDATAYKGSDGTAAAQGSAASPSFATDMDKADTKKDDSVLVVQYNDGEIYSHIWQPTDLESAESKAEAKKVGNYEGQFNRIIIACNVADSTPTT